MCLHTTSERKTATKPITVWKVVTKNNTSIYRGKQYHPGETVTVPRMKKAAKEGSEVYIGLHAGLTKHSIMFRYWCEPEDRKVVCMTIPVGAHYYLGNDGEIASDMLETGTMKALKPLPEPMF